MSLQILAMTALTIGITHTLIGVDHYIPFIVLGKARSWKFRKTMLITFIAGLGHIAGSVLIGLAGYFILGLTGLSTLEGIESTRGDLASWGLLIFGAVYGIWGLIRAKQGKTHSHKHLHSAGVDCEPEHVEQMQMSEITTAEQQEFTVTGGSEVTGAHTHDHEHPGTHSHHHAKKELTIWGLFIVFVLGPCEPLIPMLIYPAFEAHPVYAVSLVILLFGIGTIGVMMGIVAVASKGLIKLKTGKIQKYVHAISGLAIVIAAVLMLSGL
ncbi:MAG: hypothetical protein ACFFCS_03625 [Candidatus Hodarchaeota archaeon]